MMRRSFALFAAAALAAGSTATAAAAQESRPSSAYPDEYDRYSDDQLDNLVGSIALYPDALLAQVLVAATFPDQVVEAARFVRANGTSDIDDQSWDVSVKAVAHYPSALNMMADKEDWTTALGRAYASQSSDVMAAVQRMRAMADAQGNLRSTPQQAVSRDEDAYVIAPAQDRIIYVPVYDPYVVYTRPIFTASYYSPFWSFGIGFPIGGWLSYDCNWRARSVYYNGWDRAYYGYAGGWRARSVPFIRITNVYVNPRYRNVYINRDVIRRRVVYRNVDRYPGVHRDTRFGSRDVDYRNGRDRVRNDRDYRDDDRSRYNGGIDRGGYDRNRSNDRNRTNDRNGNGDRGGFDRGGSDRSRDQQRPDRPITVPQAIPEQNRGGSSRDVNRDGTWGRDGSWGRDRAGSRQSAQQDQPRRGDGRPSDMGQPQRPRDDGRSRDRGPRGDVARGPWQRNDQPMVNPRRAEPQAQAPSGNGGQRGGQRGGPRGEGRERPKF